MNELTNEACGACGGQLPWHKADCKIVELRQAAFEYMDGVAKQPRPVPNDYVECWPEVIKDMQARHEFGIREYGTALQPHNGRDSMLDAYHEALDLSVYIKQFLLEKRRRAEGAERDRQRLDLFDSIRCAVRIELLTDQPKADSKMTLRDWIDNNWGALTLFKQELDREAEGEDTGGDECSIKNL